MTKIVNVRVNDLVAKEFKEVCEKIGRTQSDVLNEAVFKTIFDFNQKNNQYSIDYMRENKEVFNIFIQKLKDVDEKGFFKGVFTSVDELINQLKKHEEQLSCLAVSCGDSYTEFFDTECMDEETESDLDAIQSLDLGRYELRIHMRLRPFVDELEGDKFTEWNALEIFDTYANE